MRGLRSAIALFLVLGGLVGYIYFGMSGPADSGPKQEKVFADLDPTKVDELKVTNDKGDVTTLKKVNEEWQVLSPVTAPGDDANASGMATALTQIQIVRVIDENPTDLKEYGLATPRIEVNFKATGDKDYRKLVLGDKTPSGSDLFAKRNDDKR